MSKSSTPSPRALRRTLDLIRPDLGPHRGLMAGGTLALLFEVVFRVLEPWPMKIVVDAVSTSLGAELGPGQQPATVSLLVWCGVALIVIVALRALSNYLATVAFALAGSRTATALRGRVFRHVQGLSQQFHARNRSADTVQRIVSDVGRMQEVAVTAGLPLVANVLTLVLMLVVMVVLDPLLSIVVVVAIALFAVGSPGTSRKIAAASRKTRKGEGHLANTAQESLSAIKVVQAYGLEGLLAERFASANKRSLKEGVRSRRLAAGLERRTDVIVGLASAAVLVGGGVRVLQGEMTPGDLVLFTTYLRTTMKPLRDMAKYTGRIARASASGERVADLMDTEQAIATRAEDAAVAQVRGSLRFEDVHVAYDDHEVLHGVTLSIEPNERVAIVGPSGSGKSTLVSLVVRAVDPSAGTVWLDDHRLADIDLVHLRRNVAVLHQEAVLFTGSVRENIRYGRLEATDGEVEQAARAAHAHAFIEALPQGYETVVGERGGTLSGGERQRVAIARALLRDARVVLLDEALTGLDPEASRAVLAAIDVLVEGRTTLTVTHDVEVALGASRLIWVERGRIVRDGPPQVLLASDAEFRAWVEAGLRHTEGPS